MIKEVKRILIIIIVAILFIPASVCAYEFTDKRREQYAKSIKQEMYDLYNLQKSLVNDNVSNSQFGVIGYNGVCSNVTVDGKSVPLDEYIAGVIKHEIGSESDNPEFMKAQAIAARSFLLSSKANSSTCSVSNSQSFQTYSPVNADNVTDQKYIAAAKATSGLVVSKDGKVAFTQYVSYPRKEFTSEIDGKWNVQMQRFGSDPSTKWVWNDASLDEVKKGNNYFGASAQTDHHYGMSQAIAGYLTRIKNYRYEDVIKLFYNEPIVSITDGQYDDNIAYFNSTFGTIAYYNQGDYANYDYGYGCGSIAACGCGPTSASIVISSITGQAVNPVVTTQAICSAGGCTSGGTINETIVQVLKNNYNLNVRTSNNGQDVINALGSGNSLVIVLMGPGTFTRGGHYIVLTAVNAQGQVLVADPGSRERNNKWYPFNTILEQKKAVAFTIISR